ncbi:MAG: c-type cytochrome [Chitinophagaceae bacterium]|nr:MAG: c-type cytochrome [Chitinophagaceae bacterium]
MRKVIMAAVVLAMLTACGGDDKGKTSTGTAAKPAETAKGTEATESADITSNPDYKKGLELIAQSDCFTCHKVDEAYTGPTYRDVANKYAAKAPAIIPELAGKIIKGGSGVWGQVPMIPHPTISEEDAEAMVKYILLLKK